MSSIYASTNGVGPPSITAQCLWKQVATGRGFSQLFEENVAKVVKKKNEFKILHQDVLILTDRDSETMLRVWTCGGMAPF